MQVSIQRAECRGGHEMESEKQTKVWRQFGRGESVSEV